MDPVIARHATTARAYAQRHLTTQTRALRRELWPEHPDPITLEQRAAFAATMRQLRVALSGISRAAAQVKPGRDLS